MTTLKTNFLGMTLPSPVIAGSSGLTGSSKKIKELEDAGAGAVVLKSLFEEQIAAQVAREAGKGGIIYGQEEIDDYLAYYERKHSIDAYIRLIEESGKNSSIPIIASINAIRSGEWTKFASDIANAGAAAIQLNLFIAPWDTSVSAAAIEDAYTDTVGQVKAVTGVPVMVKIGKYFTNTGNLVKSLKSAGADAVVLFNRYAAPDIQLDSLSISHAKAHSTPLEYTDTLRWISLLSPEADLPLVAATGIHDGDTALKMILAGAQAVEVVSTLYKNGTGRIAEMNERMTEWMTSAGHGNIEAFRGSLQAADPKKRSSLERVQFIKRFGDIE